MLKLEKLSRRTWLNHKKERFSSEKYPSLVSIFFLLLLFQNFVEGTLKEVYTIINVYNKNDNLFENN